MVPGVATVADIGAGALFRRRRSVGSMVDEFTTISSWESRGAEHPSQT